MPRKLLNKNSHQQSGGLLTTRPETKQSPQTMNKERLETLLRQKRSPEYVQAMKNLDAGGHVQNKAQVDAIIEAIRKELPEVQLADLMLGCVSKCYLGAPYEVHSLDITGEIIVHYKARENMPDGLEKARSLAYRGGYAFIEVYADCLRAVSESGAVSVVAI